MKFNPNRLLNKTFPITSLNIGNIIQSDILGIDINAKNTSDCIFWEVKSRNIDAKSQMTLGGARAESINSDLIYQVWSKVKNIIIIDYKINDDKTFTVINVQWLYGLKLSDFISAINQNIVKIEKRENSTSNYTYQYTFINLRVYPKDLRRMSYKTYDICH